MSTYNQREKGLVVVTEVIWTVCVALRFRHSRVNEHLVRIGVARLTVTRRVDDVAMKIMNECNVDNEPSRPLWDEWRFAVGDPVFEFFKQFSFLFTCCFIHEAQIHTIRSEPQNTLKAAREVQAADHSRQDVLTRSERLKPQFMHSNNHRDTYACRQLVGDGRPSC